MDENPSSPEDGLEGALRRALSDAVGGIEPGAEGLEEIRARTDSRPPRPWLLAVLSGVVERVRFWTWRGHWAWPGRPLARAHLPRLARRPHHHKGVPTEKPSRRGDAFRLPGTLGTWRIGALWLATGLASIAVIASVSLGVQPVRRAIIAASAVLDPGGTLSQHGASTNGAGAQTATEGTGARADGGAAGAGPSPTSTSGSTGGPGSTAPGPGSSAQCQPPASGSTGTAAPAPSGPGTTSSSSSAGGTTLPVARQAAVPVASGTTGAPDQPTAAPEPPATSPSTCTVPPATGTTTQPGVTGPSSTPAGTVPTDTTPADPTPTDTTPTDTPTATPTDTPTATPTDTTPTDTPTATPTGTTPTGTPTATPTVTPASAAADVPPSTEAGMPAFAAADVPAFAAAEVPAFAAADVPASTEAAAPADPGSSGDTAAGPPSTSRDNSPAVLEKSGSWRWYARLRLRHGERHRARR